MNRKYIAVCCVAARVAVGILQNLNLHSAMKRLPLRRIGIGPDEDPGVASRLEMPPFDFHDEILVHSQRPQFANRLARTMNHPILHRPRVRRTIDIAPAIKILAVEQQFETLLGRDSENGNNENSYN